jgi:alpha-1,2-mannosyltransferase
MERSSPRAHWLLVCGAFLVGGGLIAARWMVRSEQFHGDLIDLDVYRAAGRAILHGHSVFGGYVAHQLTIKVPFIYPPFSAVLAAPIALLSRRSSTWLWTAITLGLLIATVRVCFARLIPHRDRLAAIAATLSVTVVMLALTPVQEHLRFGQVGIPLMACCVFDCMTPEPSWPRGLLVGLATAIKLVPGIFIVYLWLTKRRRAALVAIATFAACTLVGVAFAPNDTWRFFTSRMLRPLSPLFFSNQSLRGMFQRDLGHEWHIAWLAAVIAIAAFGLRKASSAALNGDELRGVALTGLVGVLISPISWIHHLVWIVPVLAVIVGTGRNRTRIIFAAIVAGLFVARIPYLAHFYLTTGWTHTITTDSYGLLCIALVAYLAAPARKPTPTIDAHTTAP